MEISEAIDGILDYLRDHGTIEREFQNGPWLSITWSDNSDAGELRGTVGRLREHEFRYSRTLSIGTVFVRSVFGQEMAIVGGSADDVIDAAMRLSIPKFVAETANPGLNCRM